MRLESAIRTGMAEHETSGDLIDRAPGNGRSSILGSDACHLKETWHKISVKLSNRETGLWSCGKTRGRAEPNFLVCQTLFKSRGNLQDSSEYAININRSRVISQTCKSTFVDSS